MSAIHVVTTSALEVSEATLRQGPVRLLVFAQALQDPAVKTKLVSVGWTDADLDQAFALLHELKGRTPRTALPSINASSAPIAICEEWQDVGLVRAKALVLMTHPEQAAFLFGDYVRAAGLGAVLNVETILERIQALVNGKERKATRKADHEALALIERTGTTRETLKELAAAVKSAQMPTTIDASVVDLEEHAAERLEVLRRIHVWLTTWSDLARTVVTRRDQLISLGIARRRRPRKSKAVAAPAAPVAAPVVANPAATATESDDNGPSSRAA